MCPPSVLMVWLNVQWGEGSEVWGVLLEKEKEEEEEGGRPVGALLRRQ